MIDSNEENNSEGISPRPRRYWQWGVFGVVAVGITCWLVQSQLALRDATEKLSASQILRGRAQQELNVAQAEVELLAELRKANGTAQQALKRKIDSFAKRKELHVALSSAFDDWLTDDTIAFLGTRDPDNLGIWLRVPESGHRLGIHVFEEDGQRAAGEQAVPPMAELAGINVELAAGELNFVELKAQERAGQTQLKILLNGEIQFEVDYDAENHSQYSKQSSLWGNRFRFETRCLESLLGGDEGAFMSRIAQGEWLALCDMEYELISNGSESETIAKTLGIRLVVTTDKPLYSADSQSSLTARGFRVEQDADPDSPFFNLHKITGLRPTE